MNTRLGDPQAQTMRADLVPGLAKRVNEQGTGPLEVKLDTGWYPVESGEQTDDGMTHLHFAEAKGGVWFGSEPTLVWVRWGKDQSQEWVDAKDLVPGDEVHNLGEVTWRVREVGSRPGAGPARGTTCVVLSGDDDDGYYSKWYGGDQVYHAAQDEPVAVSWPRPTDPEYTREG